MKTVLTLASFALLALPVTAAPALADKPPRWEYAELSYRSVPARAAAVDADGKEVAPATPASMTIQWITKDKEMEAKGWDDLAEKLKLTGFKKAGSPAFQKIQVLNFLGGDGWELTEQGGSSPPTVTGFAPGAGPGGRVTVRNSLSSTWLFKRRAP